MQVDLSRAFHQADQTWTGIRRSGLITAVFLVVTLVAWILIGSRFPATLWFAVLLLALALVFRLRRPVAGAPTMSRSDALPFASDALAVSTTQDCAMAGIAIGDGDAPRDIAGVICFANYEAMAAFNGVAAARVIASYAGRLRVAIGAGAVVSRPAVNCHAIWFAGGDSADTATKQLAAIARVMAQEIVDQDLTVLPNIHVGAAQRSGTDESDAALVARARASATALNRFSTIELSSHVALNALADRFAIEQALRQAVRNGELYLHYQPFIDTRAGKIVGAETLLRWRHPKMGDVSPASFVPLLEETGLIHEIGLWTLNSACRQLNVWRRNGRSDLRLAVNLSAVQLQNPALKSLILRTVASHGLLPDALEIELTETAAMKDPVRTHELFGQLREAGFGIAIDDFGNGYSNLNYLKDLPFTKLKIDRDFVSQVDTLPGSRAICKAMVELGAGLGISVLAEGVERIEEVRALERLGCTHFQGFHFSRGVSATDLTAKLDDPTWLASLKSPFAPTETKTYGRMSS